MLLVIVYKISCIIMTEINIATRKTKYNFNNEEFLYYFQITRESFFLLFEQLAKTNAFICISWIKPQCPIASQILVFLYHIGKQDSGGGSLDIASFFGI